MENVCHISDDLYKLVGSLSSCWFGCDGMPRQMYSAKRDIEPPYTSESSLSAASSSTRSSFPSTLKTLSTFL
jgi:hypothetical protein